MGMGFGQGVFPLSIIFKFLTRNGIFGHIFGEVYPT